MFLNPIRALRLALVSWFHLERSAASQQWHFQVSLVNLFQQSFQWFDWLHQKTIRHLSQRHSQHIPTISYKFKQYPLKIVDLLRTRKWKFYQNMKFSSQQAWVYQQPKAMTRAHRSPAPNPRLKCSTLATKDWWYKNKQFCWQEYKFMNVIWYENCECS